MKKVNFKEGQTYICTKSNRMWWTVGREYKVVLNRHGDTALPDNEGHKWTLEALEELDDYNTEFKQIKETQPHKPVVPKFVAEWFEASKHALDLAIFIAIRGLDDEEWPHKTDFENWLDVSKNKPIETLIRMKDGYEVEKEPLYTVTLNLDLKYYLVIDENECDEISPTLTTSSDVLGYRYYLTEKEIKSADTNLWAFAVPVEEENK